MEAAPHERQYAVEPPAELPDLDEFTSYEDDGALVVCETSNPNAWVRSDVTTDLEP
jgi:hypothetical protein